MSSPYVDHERRVFVCRDGTELHLRPVSGIVLERLNADQSGKPQIPVVEVKIAGKHTRREPNPNDPAYIDAVRDWQKNLNMRAIKYAFVHGVIEDPPDDFVEDHREYFPEATRGDMKYLWIGSKVDQDAGDLEMLVEAITGQTSVTPRGVETAVDSFPSDGKRSGPEVVPLISASGEHPDEPGV